MRDDPYVVSRETISLQKQDEDPRYEINHETTSGKKVNGWNMRMSVNENGKVYVSGSKTIGRIGKGSNEDVASISLQLETTEHRAPKFRLVGSGYMKVSSSPSGYSYYSGQGKFIEIDDRLGRTTDSFKKENESYKHEYTESSILTPYEFLSEMVPAFEELLKDSKWDGYVSKISDEASKVQKPYNRDYVKIKLEK
jgi:hypothetical protein